MQEMRGCGMQQGRCTKAPIHSKALSYDRPMLTSSSDNIRCFPLRGEHEFMSSRVLEICSREALLERKDRMQRIAAYYTV